MVEANTSTVQVDDGVKLHVRLLGGDSTGAKPLLIGLHGAPGMFTHAEPEACFSHLSPLFRVLVFDGRGSGASDMIGPYSHERWMKDIENLRAWAGAETFVLAGHSYGGFLALDYAVNYPARLRGLILIDTWTVGTLGAMGALANILTSDRIKVDKARQIRVWSGNLLGDTDFQEAIAEMLPFYGPPEDPSKATAPDTGDQPTSAAFFGPGGQFHSKTQNWAFGQSMPRFDVRQRLKDITAPTLVAVGRHDYVTPVSFAEEIAREVPDARLEVFEHSGHSPQSDEPEKFREVLLDFLKARIL
ncbi:uncharacterized protein A1O5_00149 [Cladophialophora psammophila CBS 110553]|uniref:AB hydrolase-1 domain-containing protein n=1 Tax=Cladophialophora psammophila CBS 110553 TaxID=1182543 RepID=W9X561_9EURO|nr:uncharacterized protein A1O5_00149 [Cladophialophora psammophila CBS 110553]EXJ75642.1 hypothetical protein A1O5_00149 [Cladophialophora psammophila CBS 110553]